MPSLSPHPPPAMPPPSPHQASSGGGNSSSQNMRPPLMKRQSSASSHSSRPAVGSLGSTGEHQALHRPVKTRHTKIVLPRNHSSGRNLAKLARQAQNAHVHALDVDERSRQKHGRQRSHEGDTEIRLPGSLDESSKPPPMRRNMTAYQLPRNTSHVKLKKNLSHGQLTRLGSGRNLAVLNTQRAPPSPGLKGKSRRPKSVDLTEMEEQLQEQQAMELATKQKRPQGLQGRKGSGKKVGFAVGSVDDGSDEEDIPEMEGSGLQEDEWTEESASASPYSTRQNTANNSRRTSMSTDRMNERLPPLAGKPGESKPASERWVGESAPVESVESDSSEPPSPRSQIRHRHERTEQAGLAATVAEQPKLEPTETTSMPGVTSESRRTTLQEDHLEQTVAVQEEQQESKTSKQPEATPATQRIVSGQQREHQNPTTRRLLDKGQHQPAPALVSNVSALDDTHSARGSPAPSLQSSRTNLVDGAVDVQEDELVSRFMPSTSHPTVGSGNNTALNTPKSGFHTPDDESTFAAQQRREKHVSGFQLGPASPGSTVSAGSSGATTPAMQRSRTELRMLQEKAMADLENAADQRPHLPAHVYDRRNESLKSYLNVAILADGRGQPMGPDLFQGRFRALNTELRVVQKFRDPIGEAVARLKGCRGSVLQSRQQATKQSGLATSKSAISLPARRVQNASDLSKSASPPKNVHSLKRGLGSTQGSVNMQQEQQQQQQGGTAGGASSAGERQKGRREVSFARAPPETREFEPAEEEMRPDIIARGLWDSV